MVKVYGRGIAQGDELKRKKENLYVKTEQMQWIWLFVVSHTQTYRSITLFYCDVCVCIESKWNFQSIKCVVLCDFVHSNNNKWRNALTQTQLTNPLNIFTQFSPHLPPPRFSYLPIIAWYRAHHLWPPKNVYTALSFPRNLSKINSIYIHVTSLALKIFDSIIQINGIWRVTLSKNKKAHTPSSIHCQGSSSPLLV